MAGFTGLISSKEHEEDVDLKRARGGRRRYCAGSFLMQNRIEECSLDVITQEILPRLSAKQLQTLKIVCKHWDQIISSSYFVRLHLNLYNRSRIRVLIPRNPGTLTEYKINCDEESELQIRYPRALIRERRSRILGSCDGLICLLLLAEGTCRPHTIAVYNPSTGKCFRVKLHLKDKFNFNCSWFGHHPSSGEYVLVLGSWDELGVYKFNSRSKSYLKIVHSTSCCIDPRSRVGTLLHGAVHWPTLQWSEQHGIAARHVISAYHLDDNKYFEISPPLQRYYKLGVVDGCLFAFFTADAEIWIMKEYKVQQSWTKYANIHGFNNTLLSPLGFFRNHDVILYPNKLGLIKVTFNDNKALLLMNDEFGEATICADTLVSPKIVGTWVQ